MQSQENWLQRQSIIELLTQYILYPKYSYQDIADSIGCNKKTVQRYTRIWENDKKIRQLDTQDINKLKLIGAEA